MILTGIEFYMQLAPILYPYIDVPNDQVTLYINDISCCLRVEIMLFHTRNLLSFL